MIRSFKKFTMIELLLTISIILILMAIAIPVYGTARKAIIRQQAASRAFELKNAISTYQRDYQVVPNYDDLKGKTNSNGDLILSTNDYTTTINILRNRGNIKDNPRKIQYLDYSATDKENEFKCPLIANYSDASMSNDETKYLVIYNLKGNPIKICDQGSNNYATVINNEVLIIGFNPKDLSPDYNDMGPIDWSNPASISSDDWEILKEKAVFSSEF